MKNFLVTITFFMILCHVFADTPTESKVSREHLLMDNNWKFGFGHPFDVRQDYFHGTTYFSYLTKTGNGDGPAAPSFDDRSWRNIDLPHDWAVEQTFSEDASHSHGYKTVGRGFPETTVAWYRKSFHIPKSDTSKRISIQFDGVHRDSKVWINGFYLGNESSGYYDINYDLSPYLNYGGENVIAVRVDVTLEEGWFYEGAGIYRHVWLNKTSPLHVGYNGTFISTELIGDIAVLNIQTNIVNKNYDSKVFDLSHDIINSEGIVIASISEESMKVSNSSSKDQFSIIELSKPILWSIENPYLYKLVTRLSQNEKVVDLYETSFGVRSIHFDAQEGFLLNGKHVKLKGTCNHQDHAGVGTAIPDALQEFRIKQLKSMGSNAYRCAHNPPTPELLEACDKFGMLVMVENRLLSTAPEAMNRLERMIKRDRNHPSLIIWGLGNEEWAVEGSITGSRISNELQAFAKSFDTTRPYTVAASGGWGLGVNVGLDMMGFNYIHHGDIDQYHKDFPNQPSIGSEESNTQGTRGVYFDDIESGHMAYVDRSPGGARVEFGWQFYDERPFVAGMFLWTGFDYRGEPNPLSFPAVGSQYGILDACGFPKEPYYYLKSWWANEPFIKITPHWNWKDREGDSILVRVNSNCEEVELFLNDKSLGTKTMEKNSKLSWNVIYTPGKLIARGYKDGQIILVDKVETTNAPSAIELTADRMAINADGEDVSVITVRLTDDEGREVPNVDQEIFFELKGPGKILGVGNGNPSSHEVDRFIPRIEQVFIEKGRISVIEQKEKQLEIASDFDDSEWPVYEKTRDQMIFPKEAIVAVRCQFQLDEWNDSSQVTLYAQSLAINQSLYVNGCLVAENIERESKEQVFKLPNNILQRGSNSYVIIGEALYKRTKWEELNTNPGLIQIYTPPAPWKRRVFNGLAQVIIQSSQEPGEISLRAKSPNLEQADLMIKTNPCKIRPHVP